MSRLTSMKAKLIVFVTVSTLALAGLAVNSLATFNAVKVGGDASNQVLASERLIADVLPPPAYIIEAYLTVQQLANNTDPALDPVLRQRLVDLEADYDERQTFYVEAVTDPDMTKALKEDSQVAARQFFGILHDQFLPALDDGDTATAQSLANTEMRDAYETHRAAIDRVVELASEDSAQAEAHASSLVSQRSRLLFATVAIAFVLTALVGAAVALSIIRPVRKVVHTATVTLPALVSRIRETGDATIEDGELDEHSTDELGEATRAFNSVIMETIDMARSQAELRRTAQENFVNLGRRSQSLLSRQLQLIERAETGEDDPEVLDTLFKIDHLAARMRRNAESLLVLADRPAARKRRPPASLDDVVRAAASEIEQYQRVTTVDAHVVDIDGQYAHELVHLFAELLENAVRFSSPDTDVRVTAGLTADGCTVAVADQGIGMGPDELEEANRRLTGEVELHEANYLGHFVIGRLARRLGATVRLDSRETGGITAVVFLPNELLVGDDADQRLERSSLARRRSERAADAPAPADHDHTPQADTPQGDTPHDHTTPEAEPVIIPEPEPVTEPEPLPATAPPVAAVLAEALPPVPAALTPAGDEVPAALGGTQPSTLTAQSFGLRKRQSGSSLAKTQRAGAGRGDGETRGRNAESVRDRFSAFASGRQQAAQQAGDPAPGDPATDPATAPNEESN